MTSAAHAAPRTDAHGAAPARSADRRRTAAGRSRACCRSWSATTASFQLTLVLVYAIALLGLNILTGYNGQISLGHGAFYAIGAYTAAILMDKAACRTGRRCRSPALVCFVVGFLFGLPALRLEGLYLALATFALGVAMPQLLKHKASSTGPAACRASSSSSRTRPFGLACQPGPVALLLHPGRGSSLLFLLGWNLLRGRIGRAMMAIRDQPIAGAGDGRRTPRCTSRSPSASRRLYTGVAGALGAIAVQFVAPDSFTIFLSITLLVGIVVGGLASISRRDLRRAVHPVHAERRRPDLQGGAVGDLRRVPDRLHVPHADGRRRRGADDLGAVLPSAMKRLRAGCSFARHSARSGCVSCRRSPARKTLIRSQF